MYTQMHTNTQMYINVATINTPVNTHTHTHTHRLCSPIYSSRSTPLRASQTAILY